ncbi:MAG: TIGR02300 family protein [Alphaproteobacteria bacterium]|nr:TIGR02300 family protein [Alphaproteobacteria bacterium]
MGKPEWGNKRACQGCGARFYDLRREAMVCPKCGHQHTAESFAKTKRVRAAPPVQEKAVVRPVPEELLVAAGAGIEGETEDEEDEELIEDTSELAEDDTDVADVIGGVDDKEEDVRS